MAEARYILTIAPSSLEAAQAQADVIENDVMLDAMAISISETDETLNLWSVIAYFATEPEAVSAHRHLGVTASVAPVPDVDWVRQSLQGLAPVVAGRFFLHGSHDRDKRRPSGVSLEIDAGTAFGTGHHGTTAGCLHAFDEILKRRKPRRIFDLGCGTGVLAIAAAKATRRAVLATDIDPEATRVTRQNARLNHLAPLLNVYTAAGLHHAAIRNFAPYDLVFANILARPLASLAQGLSTLLAPGGHIILSGLTRDQQRWIEACYSARGFIHSRTITRGNWIALVMRKAGPNAKCPKRRSGHSQITSQGPGWAIDA